MVKTGIKLKIENVSKSFFGVKANDNISIEVEKGTVHAIVGENGAGKSTLMNILYGLYHADSGSIYIDGKPVLIHNPRDAIRHGIGMVHQHFMLIPSFTVTQNIILGSEVKKGIYLDENKANQSVKDLAEKFGLKIDPQQVVKEISVGMQQRIEILKCLYRKADLLILDEPTAVLTPQEIVDVLKTLKTLAENGKTVILITHKLREVKSVCDNFTVIRNGLMIGGGSVSNISINEIATMMIGEDIGELNKPPADVTGHPSLVLKNIDYNDKFGVQKLNSISLEARTGEVLGIAGVDGNGQNELVNTIIGLEKPLSGTISLEGKDLSNTTVFRRRRAGISYIPADRHKYGLIFGGFTLKENLYLGLQRVEKFSKKGFFQFKFINDYVKNKIANFDVRPTNPNMTTSLMSGGNQQKAVVARELHTVPKVVLAFQPTRGLDVKATRFVRECLVDVKKRNGTVILVSLDLDEIMEISNRIAVIYHGQIIGIVNAEDASRQKLGLMMTGITGVEKEND